MSAFRQGIQGEEGAEGDNRQAAVSDMPHLIQQDGRLFRFPVGQGLQASVATIWLYSLCPRRKGSSKP